MTKYLVKTVSTATAENENFAGEIHEYLHGKGETLIAASGDPWINREAYPAMIREYGYNRACDAKRAWSYRNPENTKWWQSTVEIIAVEC